MDNIVQILRLWYQHKRYVKTKKSIWLKHVYVFSNFIIFQKSLTKSLLFIFIWYERSALNWCVNDREIDRIEKSNFFNNFLLYIFTYRLTSIWTIIFNESNCVYDFCFVFYFLLEKNICNFWNFVWFCLDWFVIESHTCNL